MAHERHRIPDESQLSTSVPDPPPPVAGFLERFRYGARKAAGQLPTPEGVSKEASALTDFAPTFSQTTSHITGHKIRALDINQSRTHVVLAGGKLLKTLRISQDPNCIEDFNLRTRAVDYAFDASSQNASTKSKSRATLQDSNSVQRDMFDIEDVAWSNNEFRDYIATAARNGKIMLYDMNRPGVEVRSLHEHYRQVHKVDFNPLEGACLLSGSQDGTVRLWDIRSYQKSASMDIFAGRAEGVRHVKWSPRDTWSFAFGTDNGVIQRWDTRNNRTPVLKFSAHHETCNSIDWHPDGKHLISGGKDQIIKVWDISPDARGKASFHVRTPREVQNVRWRPPCVVTEPQEHQTIKQCTHFASSYRNYPVVQIWDLRRPHMPFKEVNHSLNSGTTDMLWRSRDLLWTVGPEGEFTQADVSFAAKIVERRPLASISCGPGGQITFACKRRDSNVNTKTESVKPRQHLKRSSHSQDGTSFGRSPGDDSFDEKFLEPATRKSHTRASSFKSVKSLGTTPPTIDEMARIITTDLKTTMNTYETFKAKQACRSGALPGTSQSELFTYLLQNYSQLTGPKDYTVPYLENIGAHFEQNAVHAQKASLYRDAQMWRILGYQVSKDLKHRAQVNQLHRLQSRKGDGQLSGDLSLNGKPKTILLRGKISDDLSANALSKSILNTETFSNTATPVVRAIGNESDTSSAIAGINDDLRLPPLLELNNRSDSMDTTSESSFEKDKLILGHAEAIGEDSDAVHQAGPINQSPRLYRAPYTLDTLPKQTPSISVPGREYRRDSSESFWMFSTSSESPARHVNEQSFASTGPRSLARSISDEYDSPRLNSSFQSSGSGQSNFSVRFASQESKYPSSLSHRESFLDLPTHGNLRVDDFVENRSKSLPTSRKDMQVEASSRYQSTAFESPEERLPPVERPQYPLPKATSSTIVRNEMSSEPNEAYQGVNFTPSPNKSRQTVGRTIEPQNAEVAGGVSCEDGSKGEETVLFDYLIPAESEKPASSKSLSSAINSYEMIPELLKWYSSRGDSLTASQIFFLTKPIAMRSDSATANHVHKGVWEAGTSAMQECSKSFDDFGLSPEFVESFLSTYHDELTTLELNNSAAFLRRLTYPAFPAVFEQGLKDVEINMVCLGCSHPINNPQNKMYCESCRKRQENCAICWCAHSPFDWILDGLQRNKGHRNQGAAAAGRKCSPSTTFPGRNSSLWSTCVLCNHSTHVACAEQWFGETDSESSGSGGACPVPDCTCDCVRGWYRTERLKIQEAKERQRRHASLSIGAGGGVRKDSWNVTESRAVGRVRGALRERTPGSGAPSKLGPSTNPKGSLAHMADQGRAMSDEGKRVRLVAPDESRR